MHRLALLLRVSAQAVRTWGRDFANEPKEKPEPTGRPIILKRDERWHSLKKKRHKLWIWKALDRDTGPRREGLGVWAAGQGNVEANGRSPRPVGRAAVLHRHMGDLCVRHPPGSTGAAQSDEP